MASEQPSQQCPEENTDDFWSDFSDEDFTADKALEHQELEIFYNLQTWLNSNADIDFLKIFSQFSEDNTNLITC